MSLPGPNEQADTPGAREYNRIKRRLELADMAVGLAFMIVLLTTGWTNKLHSFSVHTFENHYWLQLFVYVSLLSVINKLLGVGLDFYGFRLEHRFHLSNQKFRSWALDELKGWLLGLILATVLAEIVYGLMRFSLRYWWLIAWAVCVALLVLLAQIWPVVIEPLFYKYVPMQNEALKARLVRLCERAGTRIRGVYEWKLSEKSKKANAALTGLGTTRRIVLADTLLENYDNDEIEAVLAHELGHHVHRHLFKGIIVQSIVTLLGFWAANQVLQYARPMFEQMTNFANMPLLVLVSTVLSILLMPALNAYSRFNERQADLYCWKSVPNIMPYVSAMEKLNQQNLSESQPSRLVEILFHSHPSVSKRVAAAKAWAQRNRQPGLAS